MKTVYSIDFSKCYVFQSDSFWYKDYSDFLGMKDYIYINENNSTFLIINSMNVASADHDREEFEKKLKELQYKQAFHNLINND